MKKGLRRDPELRAKYRAIIDDYVVKGYTRKLTKKEAATMSNITWYLPDHPVINPNNPKKVRIYPKYTP